MENIKTKVDNIKTKEDEAKTKVDEYVKWENLLNEAKKEIEKLKADFQKRGLELMENKKVKQVEFWGSENSKVVVTVTETLKLVSYYFLL
jgi:F0F1-type ATP synthase membrane subunit b/b'